MEDAQQDAQNVQGQSTPEVPSDEGPPPGWDSKWKVDELEKAIYVAARDLSLYGNIEVELDKRNKWTNTARVQVQNSKKTVSGSNISWMHQELMRCYFVTPSLGYKKRNILPTWYSWCPLFISGWLSCLCNHTKKKGFFILYILLYMLLLHLSLKVFLIFYEHYSSEQSLLDKIAKYLTLVVLASFYAFLNHKWLFCFVRYSQAL